MTILEGCPMPTLLLLEDRSLDDASEPWRTAPEVEPAPSFTFGGRRVLVAEDDAGVRGMIARLLVEEGYDVVVARDGAEAVAQAFEGRPFDLLITDIRMPRMDGWELSRRLRERWPALPVLYISGFDAELTHVTDSKTTGTFLRKPFDLDELSSLVARLIDGP
jgi:DNA-binding response OmpR family regulator